MLFLVHRSLSNNYFSSCRESYCQQFSKVKKKNHPWIILCINPHFFKSVLEALNHRKGVSKISVKGNKDFRFGGQLVFVEATLCSAA